MTIGKIDIIIKSVNDESSLSDRQSSERNEIIKKKIRLYRPLYRNERGGKTWMHRTNL